MKTSSRIEILFENNEFIVVNKPAGLAVHGGKGVKRHLLLVLKEQYDRDFFPVHRLDKDTSGVLLVAKRAKVCAALEEALAQGEKNYLAVCLGRFPEDIAIQNIAHKNTSSL